MKMFFTITISGENSIEEKFQKVLNEDKNLNMNLVQGFGNILMIALRLNQDDNVTVVGLKAGKLNEENPAIEQQPKETVDNQ